MNKIKSMELSIFTRKGFAFLGVLFLAVFLFRAPTLFNDYYDVDELSAICQTWEYLAGEIPGKDFKESKHPLYHLIFKASYDLSPEQGWVIVHGITIFWVFFTAVFIYLIGKMIMNERCGQIASLLYGVLISSFNRHFMATNGEIVYNLFLAGGLFFLLLFFRFKGFKRLLTLLATLVMAYLAWQVKFHGIILILFVVFFFVVYYPWWKFGIRSRYFLVLLLSGLLVVVTFTILYFFDFTPVVKMVGRAVELLYYASSPGRNFTVFDFFIRFLHRQAFISIWHFVLWVPAFFIIYRFIRSGFKMGNPEQSTVLLFGLITYIMIFGGGARLYFHYYMSSYPFLALAAGMALVNPEIQYLPSFRKKFLKYLLIPGIFFLLWNVKDVSIKHLAPEAFRNEGKVLHWTRAVVVGTFNDYLLPAKEYVSAVNYIKEKTKSEDRVFVWGDGPYLNYFAKRRMGTYHLWMKGIAYHLRALYDENTKKSLKKAADSETWLISLLKKKKPELIVDVSGNGLSTFRFPLRRFKVFFSYIEKNYVFEINVDGFDIYRRAKK